MIPLKWLYKYPLLTGLLGLAFACLGAYFAWVSAQSYFGLPDEPEKLTLAAISERLADQKELWVEIQDGQWDCNSLTYRSYKNTQFTDALLVDDNDQVVVIVSHSGSVSCSNFMAIQPVGIISRYRSDWLADKMAQNEMGIRQYDGGLFLNLDRGSTPRRLRENMIIGLLMTAFGLTWYPWSRYMNHKKAHSR